MVKNFLYSLFALGLFSCQKEYTRIVKYYDDGAVERIYFIDKDSVKQGELETFFSSGKKKLQGVYKNNNLIDTIYQYVNDEQNSLSIKKVFQKNDYIYFEGYHSNGNLSHKGVLDERDNKIGMWKNYDENGNLHFVKEYKIINDKEFANQTWVMLPSGDTLTSGTSMKYSFDKSIVKIKDSILCTFQTDVSAFETKDNTTVDVILPEDYVKANFNPDFSNFSENLDDKNSIPIKVIPSLERQKDNVIQTNIALKDHYKTVCFYWKPKRIGKDTIRGFFNESRSFLDKNLPENRTSNRIMTQFNKKIYFDYPIEVNP